MKTMVQDSPVWITSHTGGQQFPPPIPRRRGNAHKDIMPSNHIFHPRISPPSPSSSSSPSSTSTDANADQQILIPASTSIISHHQYPPIKPPRDRSRELLQNISLRGTLEALRCREQHHHQYHTWNKTQEKRIHLEEVQSRILNRCDDINNSHRNLPNTMVVEGDIVRQYEKQMMAVREQLRRSRQSLPDIGISSTTGFSRSKSMVELDMKKGVAEEKEIEEIESLTSRLVEENQLLGEELTELREEVVGGERSGVERMVALQELASIQRRLDALQAETMHGHRHLHHGIRRRRWSGEDMDRIQSTERNLEVYHF